MVERNTERSRSRCCRWRSLTLTLLPFLASLAWNIESSPLLSSFIDQRPANDEAISRAPSQPRRSKEYDSIPPIDVAFGLSGNHPGFLSEFEVALKSVLLNAPLERALSIHVLADRDAVVALVGNNDTSRDNGRRPPLFELIELRKWTTRNPVKIRVHDVSHEVPALAKRVDDAFTEAYNRSSSMLEKATKHTMGTFFRLILNRLLPSTVKHALYMDVDVVIMTNLEELWREVESEPDALFHWGMDMCAGFLVLNVPRTDEIWTLARKSPMRSVAERLEQNPDDQLMFMSVNVTYPHEVHLLSDAWDMSAATKWQPHVQPYLQARYPRVGMLHFNGGGGSKEAYFEHGDGGFLTYYPETWGNARYYVNMPWTWARYHAKGLRRRDEDGYPVVISH